MPEGLGAASRATLRRAHAINRPPRRCSNPSPRNAAGARRLARGDPTRPSGEDPHPAVRHPHLVAEALSVSSVRPVRAIRPTWPARPGQSVRGGQGQVSRPPVSRMPPVRHRHFQYPPCLSRSRTRCPCACCVCFRFRPARWPRLRRGPGGRSWLPAWQWGSHPLLRRRLKRPVCLHARGSGRLCSRRIRRRCVCAPVRPSPGRWFRSRPGPVGGHSISPARPWRADRLLQCRPTRRARRHARGSGCLHGVRGDSRAGRNANDSLRPDRSNSRMRKRRARLPPPLRWRPAVSATRGAGDHRHGWGGSCRPAALLRGGGARRCRLLAGVPSSRAGRHDGHATAASVTATVMRPAPRYRRTASSRPW